MNGQGKPLKDKEFTHDRNFAPKQNERDRPMTIITGQRLLSSFRVKFLFRLCSVDRKASASEKINSRKET